MTRDFAAELQAARAAEDWAAHERIWEERRLAEVACDEAALSEDDAAHQRNFLTPALTRRALNSRA
jgi:hypothetical protein